MESGDGVELLLDVGLDRRVSGSAEVEIGTRAGGWSRRQVLLVRHSPSPQEIDRAVAALRPGLDGLLFVVARAGRALARAAERDHRVAYAAIDDAAVSFHGELYRTGEGRLAAASYPGRVSWVRLALLRLFALSPGQPMSQSQIAHQLGVSHVAVGKQLALPEDLAVRTAAGWQVVDQGACWDRFLIDYPGPRGLTTYWAATGNLADQLKNIERVARERGETAPAVSGDFASDFYAPWRRPSHLVAYVSVHPPLEEHGFATVRSVDATIELRTPQDPTIAAMSRDWPSTTDLRRYVDPLIAAWDLCRSPGGDVDEAADHLRAQALRRPAWA
jgi:hypothetical protein